MMAAIVGQDWRPKTLRELQIQWMMVLLESWHHTTHIRMAFIGKKTPYEKLHPYLDKSTSLDRVPLKPTRMFRLQTYNEKGERISIMRELMQYDEGEDTTDPKI